MATPSIVPIALTVDDRTGYTLWAPPWEEDGEEWQAFLGSTEQDADTGARAKVHLFPSPAALAAFCRTSTDHDLADHPVWPVVATLGAVDLTPDGEHRYDLDGVYDIAAENPDRWAVEELGATIDMVGRLAECLDLAGDDSDTDVDTDAVTDADTDAGVDTDTDDEDDSGEDTEFEAVAELVCRPEVGSLGLGVEAFLGRSGEDSWVRLGAALDELWEDVVEELGEHLDWTGAATARPEDYAAPERDDDTDDDADDDLDGDSDRPARTGATGKAGDPAPAGVSTIRGSSRISAAPQAVATAAAFWEGVGILPVEIVVPKGAGVTLRCYVEDRARFLGRDGEIWVFDTPASLARFCALDERHDLVQIASWPEVAATDIPPLPVEEDRYDLTELTDVLGEVAGGAHGLADHRAFPQAVDGVRDIAEYAGLARVEELLAAATPLGRAAARAEREPEATLRPEDAAAVQPLWNDVLNAVSEVLVFRS